MFEWEELFDSIILERGRNINSNCISNVCIDEKGISATIKGTENYSVWISANFTNLYCNCPFCKQNILPCKHLAALFFYVSKHVPSFFDDSEDSPLATKAKEMKLDRLNREMTIKKHVEELAARRIEELRAKEYQKKKEQETKCLLAEKRKQEREEKKRLEKIALAEQAEENKKRRVKEKQEKIEREKTYREQLLAELDELLGISKEELVEETRRPVFKREKGKTRLERKETAIENYWDNAKW